MERRVLKGHDERKGELLDAARALFLRDGYESTPVSAIIEAIGVSKGTFYHYFSSKQDLLEGLATRIVDEIHEQARAAVDLPATTATDKLNALLAVLALCRVEQLDALLAVVRPMYSEENLRLRDRMNRLLLEQVAPELATILRQGVEEGAFDNRFPEAAAELILGMGFSHRDTAARLLLSLGERPQNREALSKRVECCENAIERILGARRGSVRVMDEACLDSGNSGP